METSRRSTPAPCNVCSGPFLEDQKVFFCPECGEPYHNSGRPDNYNCWHDIGMKCRVHHCTGRRYWLWKLIEPRVLKFFGVERSELLSKCSNCSREISPLVRYCSFCGFDINRPEKQVTFNAYYFTRWLRGICRPIYIAVLFLTCLFLYWSGMFVSATAQGIKRNVEKIISENSTANAPSPTPLPTSTYFSVTSIVFATSTDIPFSLVIMPTSTPEYIAPTEVPAVSCSSVSSNFYPTSKGYILHVEPCSMGAYDLGPLANGIYGIGPNQNFLVYVSASDGKVFAARIGDTNLIQIDDLKRNHQFRAFLRDEAEASNLTLSFYGSNPYWITVGENLYQQSTEIPVPTNLSQ